jgi:hypothetical protein
MSMKWGSWPDGRESLKKESDEPHSGDFLSWCWFGCSKEKPSHHRVRRVGKWETGFWFSTFPGGVRRGGGNVEISPGLRDFQGAVGSVENLLVVFQAFHGPVISTALRA